MADASFPQEDLVFQAWSSDREDVLLEMMTEFYTFFEYPFVVEETRAVLRDFAQNPHYGEIWLIGSRKVPEPIGYFVLAAGFSFEYKGKDGFIDELYLREPFRGQGIGAHILEFIAGRARAIGIRCLHLELETYNEAGQILYRRFGFKDQGRLLLSYWL